MVDIGLALDRGEDFGRPWNDELYRLEACRVPDGVDAVATAGELHLSCLLAIPVASVPHVEAFNRARRIVIYRRRMVVLRLQYIRLCLMIAQQFELKAKVIDGHLEIIGRWTRKRSRQHSLLRLFNF